MAPRKATAVRPMHCAYHAAAAYTYRSLCSRKRLAFAWRIDVTNAGRYRNGSIYGALTRLLWEIILLERQGIRTTRIYELVRRAALRERRIYEGRQERREAA